MKTLIHKCLAAFLVMAASSICVFSQTRTVEHDLSPFEGIEASNGFKVSISISDQCGVKLTVDDALESYVQCYVKAGVLHLGLDEKNVPKDLKKSYKGRNTADPTLAAIVYLPTLKSLTLNDNSQFFSAVGIASGEFTINMTGSSVVDNLKVIGKTIVISVGKNAKFTNAQVTAEGDVNATCDGRGALVMACDARSLIVNGGGSALVDIKSTVDEKVKVSCAGGAGINLSGSAASLDVDGKGTSAKVDASMLDIKDATISVSGVSVNVKPSENLELDLGRGSDVTFSGNPVINIVKIQNSSVTRK